MDREKSRVSWAQVAAGALAAMSSALLLSTLGVAGTVIGAAVGSVTVTVAGAVYQRGLRASHERVAVRAAALRRAHPTAVITVVADADLSSLTPDPADATDPTFVVPPVEPSVTHLERGVASAEPRRRLAWRNVALVAAGLFVGVMLTITVFELITGRAVSTFTGGSDPDTRTTVPGVGGGRPSDPKPTGTPSPSPSETPTGSQTPTDSPTLTETPAPTGSPTGPTQPTDSGTPTASGSPTDATPPPAAATP